MSYFLHAVTGLGYENPRGYAGAFFVPRGDRSRKIFEPVAANKADRRAAEASASHARAKYDFAVARDFDQGVEFGRTHLVIVAQGFVRAVHQRPDLRKVAHSEASCGLERAFVFGNNVPAPTPYWFWQGRAVLLKLPWGYVAQLTNIRKRLLQKLHAALTFGAPHVIFRRCEFMPHHRVANDHADVLSVEWNRSRFECAAVYQKRVPAAPQHGDKLIHDAAHRSYVSVLSLLTCKCELYRVNILPGNARECQTSGHLKSS